MSISVLRRFIIAAVLTAMTTTGCDPSMPYILGNGFYSDSFSKAQVQAAANNGKVKFLGKFTEDDTALRSSWQQRNNRYLPPRNPWPPR